MNRMITGETEDSVCFPFFLEKFTIERPLVKIASLVCRVPGKKIVLHPLLFLLI